MCKVLVVLASLAGAVGVFVPGTGGLSWVSIACLLAVFARIAQAHDHQGRLVSLLRPDERFMVDDTRWESVASAGVSESKSSGSTSYEERVVMLFDAHNYVNEGWRILSSGGSTAVIARGERVLARTG